MRLRLARKLLFIVALLGPVHARAGADCTPQKLQRLIQQYGHEHSSPGRTIYSLSEKPIASGGMAEIYQGRLPAKLTPGAAKSFADANLSWHDGTPLAIKISSDATEPVSNLAREAQFMRQVAEDDPEGLFVRGFYDPDHGMLLTELRPGEETLRQWELRVTDPSKVETVIEELYRALDILKRAGVVHSDIKPSNILIDPRTLKIRIIDFGAAAPPGGYPRPGEAIRVSTESYSSPDQKAHKPASWRDDLFAIQVIAHELRDALAVSPALRELMRFHLGGG